KRAGWKPGARAWTCRTSGKRSRPERPPMRRSARTASPGARLAGRGAGKLIILAAVEPRTSRQSFAGRTDPEASSSPPRMRQIDGEHQESNEVGLTRPG